VGSPHVRPDFFVVAALRGSVTLNGFLCVSCSSSMIFRCISRVDFVRRNMTGILEYYIPSAWKKSPHRGGDFFMLYSVSYEWTKSQDGTNDWIRAHDWVGSRNILSKWLCADPFALQLTGGGASEATKCVLNNLGGISGLCDAFFRI
jgi:hypothetical protein